MPLSVRRLLCAAVALCCLSGPAASFANGIPVKTLNGEVSQFGKHIEKGKWTLVMVWTTYCGVCREEYPKISAFHEKYKESTAVVLGIALDGFDAGDAVASYREKQSHTFPSLLANAEEFAEPYEKTTGTNFSGTPTYLIFDEQQRLQAFKNGKLNIQELESFMRN